MARLCVGAAFGFSRWVWNLPVEAVGAFGEDGKFTLQTYEPGDGAPAGDYEVLVAPSVPDDPDSMSIAEFARAMKPIDARYKSFETSGLRFTVTEDPAQNQFRIQVTPPGR